MCFKSKIVLSIKVLLLIPVAVTLTACKGGTGGDSLSLVDITTHEWQELKALELYPESAYTLKEGVEYMEIRTYRTYVSGIAGITPFKTSVKKYVEVKLGKKPLDSFDPKVVERFKASSPNTSEETNIRKYQFSLMSGSTSYSSTGFMIDKKNKTWQINKVSDVIEKLGEVDTPAEAKLILWLYDNHRSTMDRKHKDRYRKTSKGYTVISEYSNSISNFGECGHFTYRIKISKKGKITENKLLKKKPEKQGCGAVD